ncbi:MAG: hypothetical protein A2Y41_03245 [Spirochaetes bacterium GWB1_36_13]|nr:MAG: hypothetical protein A2Y41_03245 [Spirochaetes bacterium GWB1_36_13]
MWPLLVFSIIVIAVLLERLIIYSGQRFNIKKLAREILPYLKERDFDKAIQVLDKNKRSAAYDIFMKGIEALKKGNKECEKAIESATGIKIIYFEKNLNILSAMGNIAPLTGFLGTVSGMITAFKTIALSDNVTARLVAGGIYEALITTAFGLIIAIIATGANNIFVHKVDGFVNQIEEAADNMIEAACR